MGKRMLREVKNPVSQTRDLRATAFQQEPIWLRHLHAHLPRSSAPTVLIVHLANLGHVTPLKMNFSWEICKEKESD